MAGKGAKKARIESLQRHVDDLNAYARTLQEHLSISKKEVEQARQRAERAEKDNVALRSQVYALQELLNDGSSFVDRSDGEMGNK